jgi:hypothetical protein
MVSMACLLSRANPSNNAFSLLSILKMLLYLIPKFKIRNPKLEEKLPQNRIWPSKGCVYILIKIIFNFLKICRLLFDLLAYKY